MINKIWGKKVGMTQVFSQEKQIIIPVTAIDLGVWYTLQRKTFSNDGYDALQIGALRNKYKKMPFSLEWLNNKKQYFLYIKEVHCDANCQVEIGSEFSFGDIFKVGDNVSVSGMTIGKGFQGCVKRHGFTGGRGSHGDKLGRRPGSLSGLRTQGRVFKGKRMPGHDRNMHTVSGLKVVNVMHAERLLLVKGAVPGKSGFLVSVYKGAK